MKKLTSEPDSLPSSSKGTNYLQLEKYRRRSRETDSDDDDKECGWRHQCGCLRTSEKLKRILKCFPSPPPPSPSSCTSPPNPTFENTCISAYCTRIHQPIISNPELTNKFPPLSEKPSERLDDYPHKQSRSWRVVTEIVQLVQLSVTATALALYYLIYCYMQLIYYTLRSAMYFHNADGPMKITIGVVTVTSLVIGFNLLLRVERLVGIVF